MLLARHLGVALDVGELQPVLVRGAPALGDGDVVVPARLEAADDAADELGIRRAPAHPVVAVVRRGVLEPVEPAHVRLEEDRRRGRLPRDDRLAEALPEVARGVRVLALEDHDRRPVRRDAGPVARAKRRAVDLAAGEYLGILRHAGVARAQRRRMRDTSTEEAAGATARSARRRGQRRRSTEWHARSERHAEAQRERNPIPFPLPFPCSRVSRSILAYQSSYARESPPLPDEVDRHTEGEKAAPASACVGWPQRVLARNQTLMPTNARGTSG